MRLPTFSRQSDTTAETEDRPPVAARTDNSTVTPPPAAPRTFMSRRSNADEDTLVNQPAVGADAQSRDLRPPARRPAEDRTLEQPVVPAGPKPRGSLLATVGLILSVAAAMLVLSGPLLGYGIGLAVLALIFSLGGVSATGKRHIAGKTDAVLGMVLSLAAIVVGVLALTSSLPWLGTDMQPVNSVREWLDAQFVNRF